VLPAFYLFKLVVAQKTRRKRSRPPNALEYEQGYSQSEGEKQKQFFKRSQSQGSIELVQETDFLQYKLLNEAIFHQSTPFTLQRWSSSMV
jgi:hypothetical protein